MKPGIDYIGVGCGPLIINEKGEALLLKRGPRSKNEAGYWTLPGGTVEFDESVEEAICRETKEEVGVPIELLHPLNCTDHQIPAERQHWVSVHYVAKIISGEPKIMEPEKTSDMCWFKLTEMPSPMSQAASESIQDYLRINHGHSH